jgi:tetratricopeptide (TPR) repeat protein
MSATLTDDEMAILSALWPDLRSVWELVRVGNLDALTPKEHAYWLLGQSGLHERQGQFAQALRCAQQTQALAEAAGWDDLKAAGLASQSSFHYSLGEFAQARAKALASLEIAADGISAVVSLNVLGLCAAESVEMDIAAAAGHFHQAADLSRLLDYALGHAMALNFLGQSVYRVRGELDLMLSACNEAAGILSKFNFPYSGQLADRRPQRPGPRSGPDARYCQVLRVCHRHPRLLFCDARAGRRMVCGGGPRDRRSTGARDEDRPPGDGMLGAAGGQPLPSAGG